MSALSSLTDVDLKQKDIVSLFENINPPDLQQLVQSCGNNTNLSNMFAYVAAVSMAQQFASSTINQSTTSSPKKVVSSSSNIHKQNENKEKSLDKSSSSAPVSSVNKLLGIVKQEPKLGTEAEFEETFSAISNATEVNDFWSNITVTTNESCFNSNESETNDNILLSSNSTNDGLPRESDSIERKRPAAIQELLQMKKARLSHNLGTSTDKQPLKFNNDDNKELVSNNELQLPLNDAVLTNNLNITNQLKEDDSETSSSSGSTSVIENNYNLICSNLKPRNSPADTSMTTRAVVDLLVSLNGTSSKDASIQYLKAIQNYPGASNILNNNSPTKTTAITKISPTGTPNRLPQRTNDNDVCESPLSSLVPHDRIFAHVPGRLSLLSNVVKYKMTVGEVKRRLMGPESFNFSLLGALLRRAKMPEKSQMLVEELNQVGLSIPRGRRRLSQVTLLSALTESESIQFANDFQRVAEAEFPVAPLAELCVTRVMSDNSFGKQNDLKMRKFQMIEQLNITLEMAKGFIQLLDNDRSPVMDGNSDPIYERVIQDPLSTFSMLTHGFGTPAIRVGIKIFVDFLERQLKYLK